MSSNADDYSMKRRRALNALRISGVIDELGVLKKGVIQRKPNIKKYLLDNFKEIPSDKISEKIYWLVHDLKNYPKKCLTCESYIVDFQSFNLGYQKDFCNRKCSSLYKNSRSKSAHKRVQQQKALFQSEIDKIDSIKSAKKFCIDNGIVDESGYKSIKTMPFKNELMAVLRPFTKLSTDNLSEHVYWIMNELQDYPLKCQICDSPIKFFPNYNIGYSGKYCSIECTSKRYEIRIPDKLKKILHNKDLLEEELSKRNVKSLASEYSSSIYPIYRYCRQYSIDTGHTKSYLESKVQDILLDLDLEFIINSRRVIQPYELDFYIKDYAAAIEVNGNFTHSEAGGKNINYHLSKTLKCRKEGISLLHFFEDEIVLKAAFVKNMIRKTIEIAKGNYCFYGDLDDKIIKHNNRFDNHFILSKKLVGRLRPTCLYYVSNSIKRHRLPNSSKFSSKIWNCGYDYYLLS